MLIQQYSYKFITDKEELGRKTVRSKGYIWYFKLFKGGAVSYCFLEVICLPRMTKMQSQVTEQELGELCVRQNEGVSLRSKYVQTTSIPLGSHS